MYVSSNFLPNLFMGPGIGICSIQICVGGESRSVVVKANEADPGIVYNYFVKKC